MKIGEILELTQSIKLPQIAKERLEIGEKKAVEALKKAGCTYTSGKRGWYLAEGTDESVKEQSIYDFSSKSQSNRRKSNASTNKSNSNSTIKSNNNSNKIAKSELLANESTNNSEVASAIESTSTIGNASASELDTIDRLLLQNDNASNQRVYRGFYWDKDVVNFLDNVKHGNKSDLMNEIVRTVLKDKGLI